MSYDGINFNNVTINYNNYTHSFSTLDNNYTEVSGNYIGIDDTVGWLDGGTDSSGSVIYPRIRWYDIESDPSFNPITIQLFVSNINNADTDGPVYLEAYSSDKITQLDIYDNSFINQNNRLTLNSNASFNKGYVSSDQFYIIGDPDYFTTKLFINTGKKKRFGRFGNVPSWARLSTLEAERKKVEKEQKEGKK